VKIVHTSDWHAGKVWKGINRIGEVATALDRLAGFIEADPGTLFDQLAQIIELMLVDLGCHRHGLSYSPTAAPSRS